MTFELIRFLLLVMLGMAAVTTAAAKNTSNTELEKVSLQLKWAHSFQFAGYYAADKLGYYREEGLDVTMVEPSLDKAGNLVEAVITGDAEYGVWSSDLINERLSGSPVVLLAVIFQHSPYIVLSRRDSEIRSPSDLIGRKVAVRSGLVQFQAMLKNEGLPLDGIEIIPRTGHIDDLIDGSVDAVFNYITNEPNLMQMRGVAHAMLRPVDYGIDFYGDSLFTSESELEQHPERVAAFRRASLKGWQYAMSHEQELIEYIMSLSGVQQRGFSQQHLHYQAEQMHSLILPEIIQIGHINPGRLQHIADTYVALGMIDPNYSLQGFIYSPDTSLDSRWINALLIGLAGIMMTAVFGWAWNKQLYAAVKQRTQELRKSEERFRGLFDNSEVAIWNEDMSDVYRALNKLRQDDVTDLCHHLQSDQRLALELADMVNVLHVNAASLEMFGASTEDELIENISKTFGEDALEVFIDELCAIWDKEKDFCSEAKFHSIDGRDISAIISFRLPEMEEDFKSIPVSIVDITERKRIEEALKKNEALLTETGRMAKVGGWEVDVTTLEVSWTEEVYRIHEIPSGGRPPLKEAIYYHHPDDRAKLKTAIKKALEQGEPYDLETRFITAKGKNLWTRSICTPITVDGEVIKLAGTFQDITERKLAEDALRENEEKFRAITATAHDAIIMLDSAGKVRLWNEAAEKTFDYQASEVEGKQLAELIIPERNRKAHCESMMNFRDTGAGQVMNAVMEMDVFRLDGAEFPVELSLSRVKQSGELYTVVFMRDISGRKQAEERLNGQLHELNRWQKIIVDREGRGRELKHEVNGLLAELGRPPLYPDIEADS